MLGVIGTFSFYKILLFRFISFVSQTLRSRFSPIVEILGVLLFITYLYVKNLHMVVSPWMYPVIQ